jgi:hypothetical protein
MNGGCYKRFLEIVVLKTFCASYIWALAPFSDVSLALGKDKNQKWDMWKFSMLLSEFSRWFLAWIYGRLLQTHWHVWYMSDFAAFVKGIAFPYLPSLTCIPFSSKRKYLPLGVELLSTRDSAARTHRVWMSQVLLRVGAQNLSGCRPLPREKDVLRLRTVYKCWSYTWEC